MTDKPKKKEDEPSRFNDAEYEIVGHEEVTDKDQQLIAKLLGKKPD